MHSWSEMRDDGLVSIVRTHGAVRGVEMKTKSKMLTSFKIEFRRSIAHLQIFACFPSTPFRFNFIHNINSWPIITTNWEINPSNHIRTHIFMYRLHFHSSVTVTDSVHPPPLYWPSSSRIIIYNACYTTRLVNAGAKSYVYFHLYDVWILDIYALHKDSQSHEWMKCFQFFSTILLFLSGSL